MAEMSNGLLRRKTRALGRSSKRLTIGRLVTNYAEGQKVTVSINVKYSGAPHPRFNGKSGVVVARRGKACVVKVMDGDKEKTLVSAPMHLAAQ